MAKQVSLIFVPRAKTKAETELHANMCRQGLIFYSVYSRMDLSHEDRENLLKLMLGATDCVLNPAPGADTSLCKCLAGEMLHTLFDVWLFSKTKNDYLWGILRSSYAKWVYLVETVKEWSASVKGLLNYIIDELYYPEKNTKSVRITCGCFSTGLELPADYIHYAWNRVVPLLGNANAIRESEPHKLAMVGISDAIQTLLALVEGEVPGAPDANTILDLFGHDLFETAYALDAQHEAGTAIAIGTLCKVFTTCRAATADKRYLAAYYNAIRSCLGTPERGAILINTLQSTELLLAQGLPGARLLVPHYVRMLERIAASPLLAETGRTPAAEALITSCINVLSMILSVGTRYQGAKFPVARNTINTDDVPPPPISPPPPESSGASAPQQAQKIAEDIKCYNDLEAHLGQILLKLLTNETLTAETRQSVLWQSYVFLREYLPGTGAATVVVDTKAPEAGAQVAPRYAWAFLAYVLGKVCDQGWPAEVARTALEVLGAATTLYEHLPDAAAYATRVVEGLAFYITDRVAAGIGCDLATTDLVAAAFGVAMRWALTGSWLASARPVFAHLVETCLVCAGDQQHQHNNNSSTSSSHHQQQPAEVAEAALQCFFGLINKWGVYPSAAGAARVSPLANEEMFVRRVMEHYGLGLPDALSCVRHYALGNAALLTFVDVPELAERDGLAAAVIIRDRTGKHLWRAQLQVFSADETAARAKHSDGGPWGAADGEQCAVPHRSAALHAHSDATNAAEATQMWMQELYASLDSIGVENISQTVRGLTAAQAKFGEESRYFLAESAAARPPEHEAPAALIGRDPARSAAGRALCAQLGYLTPYGRAGLTPLEPSSDFYAALRTLDGLPERDTLRVGVLFQRAGMGEREAFAATEDACSKAFAAFLESMGWIVDIASHSGFLGGIDRKGSMGKRTLYYADHATEVAFHVAPFIHDTRGSNDNNEEEQQQVAARKKRVIAKDHVLIVWSDDGSYSDAAFPGMQQDVRIIISPVPRGDGLYKVEVRCSDRLRTRPGPLRGTMMVSRRALGPLVRLTAISGHHAAAEAAEGVPKPFALRQAKIADIVKAHKTDIPPAQLFASQFFYDPQAHANVTFPPRKVTHRQRSHPIVDQQPPQISTIIPPPAQPAPAPAPAPAPVVATPPLAASASQRPVSLSLASNFQQQQQQMYVQPTPAPVVAGSPRVNIGPPAGPPPPQQSSTPGQGLSMNRVQGSASNMGIPPPSSSGMMSVKRGYSGMAPPAGPAPVAGGSPQFKTRVNPAVGMSPQGSLSPGGGVTQKRVFSMGHPPTGAAPVAPGQKTQVTIGHPPTGAAPVAPGQKTQITMGHPPTGAAPVAPGQKTQMTIGHPPTGAAPVAPGQKTQMTMGHPPSMLGGNRMPPQGMAPQSPMGMNSGISFKSSPIMQKQYAHQPPGMAAPVNPLARGAAPQAPQQGGTAPYPNQGVGFGVKRQFLPAGPAPPAPN